MRNFLVTAAVVPLLLLVGCGMARRDGLEASVDQVGDPYAHKWTDDDARIALWYTRNYPDDFAALGFALSRFRSYNQHNERYGQRGGYVWPQGRGEKYGSFFHSRMDDYVALIDDPQLRVKMLSLEARERNRMRERDRRRQTGTWPYDPSSAPDRGTTPSRLDDAEVEQHLMDRYR